MKRDISPDLRAPDHGPLVLLHECMNPCLWTVQLSNCLGASRVSYVF